MQTVPAPLATELLATGQRPYMVLEVAIPGIGWVNICNLGGKNYLKDISFSLGGARMTPDPMAADWSAVINNEGNIFHPFHPTSTYKDLVGNPYFQAGRHVRISIGGTYASGPKRWQRIIGVMDEPIYDVSGFELTISGLDYMKVLSDMNFNKEIICSTPGCSYTPIDNYWGNVAIFNSVTTEGTPGIELYTLGDAMETVASLGEAPNVTGWLKDPDPGVTFVWALDGACLSTWTGKATWGLPPGGYAYILREPAAGPLSNLTKGQKYKFEFKYRRVAGTGSATFLALQSPHGICDQKTVTPADALCHQDSFIFKAITTGKLRIVITFDSGDTEWRVDEFSIKTVTPAAWNRYNMAGLGCKGIYYVELDEGGGLGFQPVWPGKQKGEGWYYDADTEQFYFDEDRDVAAGFANLRIYYFTTQSPHNVVADILVKAGLYGNRAAALHAATGMIGTPWPTFTIDRVWFNAGSTYINAIKMICERCNRRFYFRYDGRPTFIIPPTVKAPPDFEFTRPRHIASPNIYQDRSEIWNTIVIEGEKRAELTGWEENMPSELKHELSDPTSITNYGEHTKTIKNHLFQDQLSITNMCIALLAAYQDPNWYFNFDTPYNAVPLELGDTVRINVLLMLFDPTIPGPLNIHHTGLVRDIHISQYDATYKCERV